MTIAVLGAGEVGRTLGHGLSRAGHDVLYAVRDPSAAKHVAPGTAARAIGAPLTVVKPEKVTPPATSVPA